ncbi:polyamine-transporting ATPase 13A3-like isoform X2 [Corythoichthys intestinalis]|uniref:polyamine-transporting ATPase 13A3-like isoform X2 n=1 Tax=Corythoichthys intestinalis TaxID=161448 RepID=UPI0025A5FCD4|nr:polyamine-transporting ATPase 13A3-like isoform X2 [Corythoichthys intestinalis]
MKTTEEKLINRGSEDEMEVRGYRPSLCRMTPVAVGGVCTGGLLFLLFYWLPEWGVKASFRRCSLKEARILLLRTTDEERTWICVKVHVLSAPGLTPFDSGTTPPLKEERRGLADENQGLIPRESFKVHYFTHKRIKYYWNESTRNFERFKGLEDNKVTCAEIHRDHSSGLRKTLQRQRALFFGVNEIDVSVPSLIKIFVKEVMNPFYCFQLFALILWALEDFYDYSIVMAVIFLLSIAASLYTIRKQHVRLHNMVVQHSVVVVSVCRGKKDFEEVLSTELVPGDVLAIPANGMVVPCDAALISGTCIVNESMLTGESVPVTKTSLPNSGEAASKRYTAEEHKQHSIFCGSRVIQSRYRAGEPAKAVVVRTGFSTAKGQLVHSILYPKPTDFKLHRDATQFLMGMVVVAIVGFVYTVVVDVLNEVPLRGIIFDSLNIVTVAVPPILPVALASGIAHAQHRLKRLGLFCVSPQRINICGQLNLLCFDKTGTLTEDCLDLWAIQRAQGGTFLPRDTEVATEDLLKTSFVACMSTCHTLTTVEGQLCGDPLDLKVFTATGSILEEPKEEHAALYNTHIVALVRLPQQSGELGIVHQFPFSSSLQRMTVLVRRQRQTDLDIYLKGAPETVAKLCKAHTGRSGVIFATWRASSRMTVPCIEVPESFGEILEAYTRQGLRVIALAHRQLETEQLSLAEIQSLEREQMESNMDFLGLIIMQNKIKEQTAGALLELRQADIRTLMVTGDNLLTAISVARDCGMVRSHEKVIIVDAAPPHESHPARVTWHYSGNSLLKNNQMCEINFDDAKLDGNYHLAASGRDFAVIAEHFPSLLQKLLLRGTVFARMSPNQKTQLVQALQSMDYIVGMCGDGANDSGALKKAHCGISLSELEASVASPFTSSIPNISCIPNLIREGRAALVTSFCVFKYLALFSTVFFCGMTLLYWVLTNFGIYQMAFIDTGISFFVVFSMCLSPACEKLVRQTPATSLISCSVLFSVVSQFLNCLLFLLVPFLLVQQQSWYEPPVPIFFTEGALNNSTVAPPDQEGPDNVTDVYNVRNFENTSIFYVSAFQFLTLAITLSKGKPFRQPFYKNWVFMLSVLIQYALLLFFLLQPIPAVDDVMQIADVPYGWRITILIIAVAHALASFILEILIPDTWRIITANLQKKGNDQASDANTKMVTKHRSWAFFSWVLCCKKRPPKSKYKRVALELRTEPDWPPVPSAVTYADGPRSRTSVDL